MTSSSIARDKVNELGNMMLVELQDRIKARRTHGRRTCGYVSGDYVPLIYISSQSSRGNVKSDIANGGEFADAKNRGYITHASAYDPSWRDFFHDTIFHAEKEDEKER